MWSKLRTFVVVTLVTVLIWVWADAETQPGRGADLLHADSSATAHPPEPEAEFTVPSLPVMLVVPTGGGEIQWDRVRLQQTELYGVTIAGPRTVVERLKRGDTTLRLSALFILDRADWGAGVNMISKSVELSPGGVGLRFAGPAPTVRASISR